MSWCQCASYQICMFWCILSPACMQVSRKSDVLIMCCFMAVCDMRDLLPPPPPPASPCSLFPPSFPFLRLPPQMSQYVSAA